MINTQLKIIFVDVPKTGSSSIKTLLIRGFNKFIWQCVANSNWINNACHSQARYTSNPDGSLSPHTSSRHEPLLSKYMMVGGMNTYFIFTVVRNPFDRFKSTFIEEILYNKYKFKTISMGSSLTANNRSLVDPWIITGHEHLSTQQKNSVELQAELLINKLRILRDKGGFERLGVCETPIHLWPQHYFTSLTTPEPLNYRILKYEYLKKDIPVLKNELSRWSGVDINNQELPHIDPIANFIFSQNNPLALDTMGYIYPSEREIRQGTPDFNFIAQYPTFPDFAKHLKTEKEEIKAIFDPFLEDHRGLIEDLYRKDYQLFEYT
jgi:hypothetical protein